ncbi:hypothetical protein AT864_02422 [Anoxybacillus sp. P3H1B]|nr:hypothetical protein AT864_02422 [Anoxybacillus sp. P3H1B]MBB3905843.1 hypothetical protein [Anoxybacillus rupiensis]
MNRSFVNKSFTLYVSMIRTAKMYSLLHFGYWFIRADESEHSFVLLTFFL